MKKIPNHAKKVFKGVIFEVYQWEQKLYDGSTATFERLKRPDTICIIPVIDDNIVIAKEEQPTKAPAWTLVGGRQDPGEEPLTVAKRELLEETGMVADDWELFLQEQPAGKLDWNVYIYIARNCRKIAEQALDGGEKIDVHHVSFDEFVRLTTEELFWGNEITTHMLRCRIDEKKMNDFKKQLGL